MSEEAVIVRSRYGQVNLEPLFQLEERLQDAIDSARVGEYDGHDVASDLSDCVLYMYGPNADLLFEVVKPILERTAFLCGGEATLRFGPAEEGVPEQVVALASRAWSAGRCIIAVPELDQLSPEDRWARLVAPLSEALESSGVGTLLDLESMRREAQDLGRIQAEELAVEVTSFGYCRELVDELVSAAGLTRKRHQIPRRWGDHHCDDYFASELAESGYYDQDAYQWLVQPADAIYEDPERGLLVLGGPGVDGIEWGYRQRLGGVWAWYPIGGEFQYVAPTVEALLDGWHAGTITL